MIAVSIKGGTMLVDPEDEALARARRWTVSTGGYARASLAGRDVLFHRCVVRPPDGIEVDHINGNKLDNRRCNLRLATRAENARNRKLSSNSTSGVKGVSWDAQRRRWRTTIYLNWRRHHVGWFADLGAARAAYDKAARKLHGAFAQPNMPEVEEP